MSRSWKLSVVALGTVALVGCGAAPDVFVDGDGVESNGADVPEAADEDPVLGGTADEPGLSDAQSGFVAAQGPDAEEPVAPTASCWFEFGNPSCADVRLGTEMVRISKVEPGQYWMDDDRAMVEVLVSEDSTTLGFISSVPVDALIMTAGPGALVCKYPQSTVSDGELVGQVDNTPEQVHPATRVSFCDLTFSKVEQPLDPS